MLGVLLLTKTPRGSGDACGFQLGTLHRWPQGRQGRRLLPGSRSRSVQERRARGSPATLALPRTCTGKSLPASELPQQTGPPGASCYRSSEIIQPAPRLPPVPLDGSGTGRRAGCKLDELFRQWQLLPAAILPRGHLPVTSQPCNPHVTGEQPSSHQEGLGPGGSCGCCQNNPSDTQPVPYTLQSRTQGEGGSWEQAAGLINCPICHKSLRSIGRAPVPYSVWSSCFQTAPCL